MRCRRMHRALPLLVAACGLPLVGMVPLPGLEVLLLEVPRISVPRTAVAPLIDGALNDACWQRAAVIHGFHPCCGGSDQVAIDQRPTEVRLLWDADNLYVGFSCRSDDIFSSGTMQHDDDLYKEDVCEVFIDGKGDQRQWIEIQVSPGNQTLDLMAMLTADPVVTATGKLIPAVLDHDLWTNRAWNAVGLRTATARLEEHGQSVGWTVELAIPAQNIIRRTGGTELHCGELRGNFLRYDHPRASGGKRGWMHMNWAPVERGCPHISPAAMGRLLLVDADADAGVRATSGNGQP